MNYTHMLWLLGNVASIFIGAIASAEHGLSIGFAIGFALMVLVDIRRATMELKP